MQQRSRTKSRSRSSEVRVRAKIHVESLVVCEDVRKEITGKDILIGVYGGDIVAQIWPVALRLAIWLETTYSGNGEIPVVLRVRTDHNTEIFTAHFTAQIGENQEHGVLSFGGILALLTDPCDLVFELRQYDEPWQVLKTKKVERASKGSTSQGSAVPGQSGEVRR